MPNVVNYKLTRGLPWERYVCVKSRRTHWRLNVSNPNAYIQVTDNYKKEITSEITSEGIIKLSLTKEETVDLPEGNLLYDVWATVQTHVDSEVYQPVTRGTINVETYANVAPSDDADTMELRFTQRTDFRRIFTLEDDDGDIQEITDAYMQAKDSSDTTVLDIRWYASAPEEDTVIALSPANRRGYIAPSTGASFELHISNANTVAAGTYDFDIFVKDTADDWTVPIKGTIIVEEAISSPPA
jgi:hypothetical protein